MTATVPLAVWIHLCVALPALAIGVVMVARPKGTPSHKLIGRIWVALMLAVAISSLWIPHFLHFTWIHLFTLLTLVSIPAAIYKIRTGNVAGHGRAMTSLFLGGLVIAGLFTLLPGRLLGNLLWHGTWGYNG